MAGTQDILNSVLSMQQNAQAALPVIPNNGNPNGAHNMQHQATSVAPAMGAAVTVPEDRYPWLRPSQSMENVRRILKERSMSLQNNQAVAGQQQNLTQAMPAPVQPQPVLPVIPQPVAPPVQQGMMQPEPRMNNNLVIPQRQVL